MQVIAVKVVNAIIGRGSSNCASRGERAEKSRATMLTIPNAVAEKITGNSLG